MVLLDPILDHLTKLFRFLDKLLGFGLGDYARYVVVYLISHPTTGIKIVEKSLLRCSQNETRCFQCGRVMTSPGRCPIAFASQYHLCELQDGIVSHGEPSVGGQLGDGRVLQVAVYQGPQLIEFVSTCLMSLCFSALQKLLQTHAHLLRERVFHLARQFWQSAVRS